MGDRGLDREFGPGDGHDPGGASRQDRGRRASDRVGAWARIKARSGPWVIGEGHSRAEGGAFPTTNALRLGLRTGRSIHFPS